MGSTRTACGDDCIVDTFLGPRRLTHQVCCECRTAAWKCHLAAFGTRRLCRLATLSSAHRVRHAGPPLTSSRCLSTPPMASWSAVNSSASNRTHGPSHFIRAVVVDPRRCAPGDAQGRPRSGCCRRGLPGIRLRRRVGTGRGSVEQRRLAKHVDLLGNVVVPFMPNHVGAVAPSRRARSRSTVSSMGDAGERRLSMSKTRTRSGSATAGLQRRRWRRLPLVEGLLAGNRRLEQVRTEGGGSNGAGRQARGTLE